MAKIDYKKRFDFIKDEHEWEEFVKREKLRDYSQLHVPKARMRGGIKLLMLLLRIYIIVMVILIVLGFLNVL